jgi:hypothetical protein
LLRVTRTAYETNPGYVNRHIFSLPKVVEVYGASDASELASRSEYSYDGQLLSNTPDVVQHNRAYNPDDPGNWIPYECREECDETRRPPLCFEVCEGGYYDPVYDATTSYRGNVTQIRMYADAANLSGAITEERRYDITDNLISSSRFAGEQTSFQYTVATQYAYPTNQTRSAADPNLPQARVTTTAVYDFNTGLMTAMTDGNGRYREVLYWPDTLRPRQIGWKTQGSNDYDSLTQYLYDDDALSVRELTTGQPPVGIVAEAITYFNEIGLVRRKELRGDGSLWGEANVWHVIQTQYD